MPATETPTFEFMTTYRLPDGAELVIAAHQGSQVISSHSGPMNATEFGGLALTITDADGARSTLALDSPESAKAALKAIEAAYDAAWSRDVSADLPLTY